MNKNLTEQTEIDTTELKLATEGFSELITANNQNSQTNTHNNSKEKSCSGLKTANNQNSQTNTHNNSQEKGFSDIVNANSQNNSSSNSSKEKDN